jgi:hypothetical protein
LRNRSTAGLVCIGLVALLLLGGGVAHAVSGAPAPSTPTNVNWHFEGRHSGTEIFQVHTGRCPVLDHLLQETFTLTDGTTWSFQAHYCGTIDSRGVWTGVGSFSIATAGGSTLSGRFTDSAQLPSLGVPYELDVHQGTGVFAGAHGSCILDNHLSTIAPAVQHQEGIFVCDLAP